MPTAISIKAANGTAEPIRALWEQVGRLEDQPSMHALGYAPHITLAVYDGPEPRDLRSALHTAFRGRSALSLAFDRIRAFEGRPLVLWAAPSFCPDLGEAHEIIHDLIDPALCRPHYRPGSWVPHCSLGTQVREGRRDEALALTCRPLAPFEVIFDVADCVRFPPVAVIEEHALGPHPSAAAPRPTGLP